MEKETLKYQINLSFEEIKLPPFQEILVLGKNSPQGKIGLFQSFNLLLPDNFLAIDVEDEKVEAVFINKRILAKVSENQVIAVLKTRVFPYISEGEVIKVDFKLKVLYDLIEL
ncbi:MAG: hypothetical protein HC831_30530 [Chloroflexia bacterium]|nr:hypothetical protein [Chloroflexia bacterium]